MAPAGDFYALLGSALSQATKSGVSRETQVEEMSASGTLIPPSMTSPTERISYLSAQRERLQVLLSALDKEASNLSLEEKVAADVESRMAVSGSRDDGLRKSKSEADFDTIDDAKEASSGSDKQAQGSAGGGWMPWNWRAKAATSSETPEMK